MWPSKVHEKVHVKHRLKSQIAKHEKHYTTVSKSLASVARWERTSSYIVRSQLAFSDFSSFYVCAVPSADDFDLCSNICAGMVLFADNILTSWLLFFFWSRQDMYGLKSEQTIECWRWKFQLVAINLTMMSIKSKKNETRLRISLECSVNKFDVFWAKKPEKFASCRFIVIFDLIGHVSPKNSKSRTFHWAINLLSLMSLQKKSDAL